ncbi:aspartate aminotransferase [Arthrobacter crystallopoietes BAB-32]|uniref:Aspartate aminotransferase n=1 Tax=Arthrobacter crystallopoietes BAB-32 TaxID=1246476 RepID=N1V3P9_9MICC|nr:aminotransferase class I/II-fold pyridoxal phosphate-dependent enzyme [Arthrobacter crystallopoietes]EMY35980.1 aspartate aminotransferase [Arthrobacter crystallopoietes BAB-32]
MTMQNHTAGPKENRSASKTSRRVHAAGIDGRIDGVTVREADRRLLACTGPDALDTTHFDTVRFPAPEWAEELFAEAAADGSRAYSLYRGSDEVRAALAPVLTDWLGFDVDADQNILLTPGTQAGLFTSLTSLVDPGDDVVLFDPEYLFSERILTFLGANIRNVPILTDGAHPTIDFERLESVLREGPKLIVFSHPNNPTGTVYPQAVLERIAELAVRYDVQVLVDELYSRLVYPGTTFVHLASLPGMRERTVTLLGPSKTESLSGYRLGVVVAPDHVVEVAEDVLAFTSLRAPAYAQNVLKGWLVKDVEWVAERVADLAKIRQFTIAKLSELEWLKMSPQQGTAYLFVDVRALGLPDTEIAEALAREANVLISPGYQFGPGGVGHLRICFARDEEEWRIALGRIVDVLQSLYERATTAAVPVG